MLKLKKEIQQEQQNYHDQECVLFLRHWAKSLTLIHCHLIAASCNTMKDLSEEQTEIQDLSRTLTPVYLLRKYLMTEEPGRLHGGGEE